MVGKAWASSTAMFAAGLLVTSGCAEGNLPLAKRAELSTGAEVFHILCKRVAAAAYPDELTGVRFNDACDGGGEAPEGSDPRFIAMVERREEIVASLDQVFGDQETKGSAEFADGELDTFLSNLIPFYDPPDEWTPKSTRALANIMGELLSKKKSSEKVLATLARVAPRVGYRPIKQVLGAVRPSLTYPRLDELTRQFLKLVTKDGSAYPAFTDLLKAGSLELAEPKTADAPAPENSTLRVAMDLLLASDPLFARSQNDPALWVVQRDANGFAVPTDAASKPKMSPFPRVLSDKKGRDADGRAMDGDTPLYQYVDANRTLLAALLREQKTLLERDGDKSVVEKLARGLRAVLGPTIDREESFGSKAKLKYKGPDVEHGALLELVHALSALARYPETEELLMVLDELMRNHESDGTAAIYAGLRIDELSDEYPNAKFIGVDGEGSPHEFWDDLIQIGTRMMERPGQLDAVLKSFADPQSVASTRLIAKFMKYKDQVSYNGAPIAITDGHFSAAAAEAMNTEIQHTFKVEVERSMSGGGDLGGNLDVGMNRSLFQRLISTIHATNGVPNCNKAGAKLNVVALDILPIKYPLWKDSWSACEFVKQPNGAEAHMRSMLGRAVVVLKDRDVVDGGAILGGAGAVQEEESQIHGFTLEPTPTSIARFIHVPRNKFMSDIFDPFATKHGVPVAEFEPDILLALEMKQPDIVFADKGPQSFLTAAVPLGKAFDDTEIFTDSEDGKVASKGYMFADLLSTLHMHWPSRRPAEFRCPATVKKGDEGCTQSGDPKAKFFAHQSNLVSYEPILVRALEDEQLGAILQKANATLGTISITGVLDGKKRDGITVLANFLRRVLTPDETLAYRDGRTYSHTNTCVPMETTDAGGKLLVECADARGRIVSGKDFKGVMPLYLVLDALKSIDKAFEGDNVERHGPWLQARSALVDQFLSVDKDDVTNPAAPVYSMKNRRAYATTLQLVPWIKKRIEAHRVAQDLPAWADGLTGRLAGVLAHPATAAGLDLLEVLWKEDKAGEEFAKLNAYLMDEEGNPDAFQGLIVAATDTLILVDRDPDLTPLVQFASLALAPNALEIIENGGAPKVEESATLATLELTKRITDLYPGPDASSLSRLLKNAVLADASGQSPLEEFIDSSAEVNRAVPMDPRDKPLTADDYRAVFEQVKAFLSDGDRGLERLYKVIQGRDLSKAN